jgi:hypothetical protein
MGEGPVGKTSDRHLVPCRARNQVIVARLQVWFPLGTVNKALEGASIAACSDGAVLQEPIDSMQKGKGNRSLNFIFKLRQYLATKGRIVGVDDVLL